MAFFTINGSDTTAETLNNEVGHIGVTGALNVLGTAVTANGNSYLSVAGSLQGFNTTIDANGAALFNLLVTQTGSITGFGPLLEADVTDAVVVVNDGAMLSNGDVMVLTPDAAAVIPVNYDILNSGTISANRDAIFIQLNTSGFSEINNSGTILANGNAIDNSISTSGLSHVHNSGHIQAGQSINEGDWAYLGGSSGDYIVNTGTISGNIHLSGGGDRYDGSGGGVTAGIIDGGSGEDTLLGSSANDFLDGGSNNDTLTSNGGYDTLLGGEGSDLFNVSSGNEIIVELANQGQDTVRSSIDHELAANVEHLTLIGSQDINGSGTNAANTLNGNAGDNVLYGLNGNDTILAGNGDDTLRGHNGNDLLNGNLGDDFVFGGAGNDTVKGGANDDHLEGRANNDSILGELGNDLLRGGGGSDTLLGGSGSDTLTGGMGADTLTGGADDDYFDFNAISDSAPGQVDVITDFTIGEDLIDLRSLIEGQFDMRILTGFNGAGPQVRTFEAGGHTQVYVDVNGDAVRDMRFDVLGVVGLTENDFLA